MKRMKRKRKSFVREINAMLINGGFRSVCERSRDLLPHLKILVRIMFIMMELILTTHIILDYFYSTTKLGIF